MVNLPPNSTTVQELFDQAVVLHQNEQLREAEQFYAQVLAAKPDHFDAGHMRAVICHQRGENPEALTLIDAALQIRPASVWAHSNRSLILRDLGRYDEALASCDRALALNPRFAEALNNRGTVQRALKRPAEALENYDRALALQPNFVEALNNRGTSLQDMKRYDEALASYDRALAIQPTYADALGNRAGVLIKLGQHQDALASYEQALASNPSHPHAFGALADCAASICYWTRTAKLAKELTARVREEKSVINPFTLLAFGAEPADQLRCAQNFAAAEIPKVSRLADVPRWHHDKMRIAYLSSDFRFHPISVLAAQLFELHDRSKFEVSAVSFGPDDASSLRARLVKAFDRFHDVRTMSDREVAMLLRANQIDIAIDLNNYSELCRPGILAHRPVPVQVAYLGYPSTLGVDFIDYFIADKFVLPREQEKYWTEKIVRLPDSYLVQDSRREISRVPSRSEAGLPNEGFVFCGFNAHFKITAPVFDIWMRLLGKIQGSVLWLSHANDATAANLRREAEAREIDPARIIFASRLERMEDHLARHRLADLFLDTLPYNAHTTAGDALWSGLPVLTCAGEAFAGRVAASLLHAVGLPELVTTNLGDYEALALKLAADPSLLRSLRDRLAENRATSALFDAGRFRRHIEAAYTQMWDIWRRGESPRSFDVEALN
jgi:predicted O-linked N-acetylglucosamine transferase (SPINDLY family)